MADGRGGRFTFLEWLTIFGYLVEEVAETQTVAGAAAAVRFHASPSDYRGALHAVMVYLDRAVAAPQDSRKWRIRARDEAFEARVARLSGGEVMASL